MAVKTFIARSFVGPNGVKFEADNELDDLLASPDRPSWLTDEWLAEAKRCGHIVERAITDPEKATKSTTAPIVPDATNHDPGKGKGAPPGKAKGKGAPEDNF